MLPDATIVGQVWKYGEECTTVVLTLQGDAIEWTEFRVGEVAAALAGLEDARRGVPGPFTRRTIPLVRVRRVEVDAPDPNSQPRKLGTLTIVTGGLFGNHDVVCAYEDDCPWPAFTAFAARVEEAAGAARAAPQAPQAKRALANPLRKLADRLLVTKTVCPRCGAEVQDVWVSCPRCGQELAAARAPEPATCARCGRKVPEGSAFCPHCGARQG